ncbi:MAG: type II toxin-antitoxin system Phd/YefM family antitoxin [Erysipelotrichaceae bacterium]|nr:type II toxin-antitoxin system Phd/YefM family antitoxin [Erysipelotrichaceae bacterium]
MLIASATQMKNGFGRYLDLALRNGEVYVERHGAIVAKLMAVERSKTYISDELKVYKKDESAVRRYCA